MLFIISAVGCSGARVNSTNFVNVLHSRRISCHFVRAKKLISVCLDLVVGLKSATSRIFDEFSIWIPFFHSQKVVSFSFVDYSNLRLSPSRHQMSYRLFEYVDGVLDNTRRLSISTYRKWRKLGSVFSAIFRFMDGLELALSL